VTRSGSALKKPNRQEAVLEIGMRNALTYHHGSEAIYVDAPTAGQARHSREGGNPEAYPPGRIFQRRAPSFFDGPPFGRERTRWIPAFAGMTVVFLPSRE
jgi:hypothetical protein